MGGEGGQRGRLMGSRTTMQLMAGALLQGKKLEEDVARLQNALRKITKREGPHSRDAHEQAENTIDAMAGVAEDALNCDLPEKGDEK